jgi:hypothetical protein
MARPKRQTAKVWQPMERGPLSPDYVRAVYDVELDPCRVHFEAQVSDDVRIEVWSNDVYSAVVEYLPTEWAYITLKRHDRRAVRDWRHLQSIKNEVVGPEREAMEIFPAESRLMDTSNQYHLWVLPEAMTIPVGQRTREVYTAADSNAARVAGHGKARQRPFQPGLSTGPTGGR